MARNRKRAAVRDRERAERQAECEIACLIKELQTAMLNRYMHQVQRGAVCPVCGLPLVDPSDLVSLSVQTEQGIVHQKCA